MKCPNLLVKPYTTTTKRLGRGARHKPIPAGTTVFLIEAEDHQTYFAFCYLQEEDAKLVIENIKKYWSETIDELEINFNKNPEWCLHVGKLY